VGAWNRAILNPDWLAVNIFDIPKGQEYTFTLSIDNTGTRTKTTINDINFIPSSERLVISVAKDDPELFKVVAEKSVKLCDKLPHTPITGIGHNFSYQLDENENFVLDIDFRASKFIDVYKEINASPNLLANKISILQHSLSLEQDKNVILNLSFHLENGKKMLRFNYHHGINDIDSAKYSLKRYYDNYLHSQLTTSKLIIKGDNKNESF